MPIIDEQQQFENERKKAMYEIIADKLENIILSDETQIAQKLPSEQTLATSFNVSRPVIREALKLLSARGLIEQKNGEGSFICEPSPVMLSECMDRLLRMRHCSVGDLLDLRLLLEAKSCFGAAEHITVFNLRELEAVNERLAQASDDPKLSAELDIEFHIKIAMSCGNPALSILIESLLIMLKDTIVKTASLEKTNQDAIAYHKKIIDALKEADAAKAEELIRAHLITSMRNYEVFSFQNIIDS